MQCWKVDIGRSCKGISDQRTGIRYNGLRQRRNGEKGRVNKVILVGRLTRIQKSDMQTRRKNVYSQDIRWQWSGKSKRNRNQQQILFPALHSSIGGICCKLFPAGDADHAVSGRIQTGSYVNREGIKYTTDVIIEEQEFAEAGRKQEQSRQSAAPTEKRERRGSVSWMILTAKRKTYRNPVQP